MDYIYRGHVSPDRHILEEHEEGEICGDDDKVGRQRTSEMPACSSFYNQQTTDNHELKNRWTNQNIGKGILGKYVPNAERGFINRDMGTTNGWMYDDIWTERDPWLTDYLCAPNRVYAGDYYSLAWAKAVQGKPEEAKRQHVKDKKSLKCSTAKEDKISSQDTERRPIRNRLIWPEEAPDKHSKIHASNKGSSSRSSGEQKKANETEIVRQKSARTDTKIERERGSGKMTSKGVETKRKLNIHADNKAKKEQSKQLGHVSLEKASTFKGKSVPENTGMDLNKSLELVQSVSVEGKLWHDSLDVSDGGLEDGELLLSIDQNTGIEKEDTRSREDRRRHESPQQSSARSAEEQMHDVHAGANSQLDKETKAGPKQFEIAMDMLKNVTVKDAQKSFVHVCQKLYAVLKYLLRIYSAQDTFGALFLPLSCRVFDGIRAVYAVCNTAIGKEQGRNNNSYQRLLKLAYDGREKLFSSRQIKELHRMMQTTSASNAQALVKIVEQAYNTCSNNVERESQSSNDHIPSDENWFECKGTQPSFENETIRTIFSEDDKEVEPFEGIEEEPSEGVKEEEKEEPSGGIKEEELSEGIKEEEPSEGIKDSVGCCMTAASDTIMGPVDQQCFPASCSIGNCSGNTDVSIKPQEEPSEGVKASVGSCITAASDTIMGPVDQQCFPASCSIGDCFGNTDVCIKPHVLAEEMDLADKMQAIQAAAFAAAAIAYIQSTGAVCPSLPPEGAWPASSRSSLKCNITETISIAARAQQVPSHFYDSVILKNEPPAPPPPVPVPAPLLCTPWALPPFSVGISSSVSTNANAPFSILSGTHGRPSESTLAPVGVNAQLPAPPRINSPLSVPIGVNPQLPASLGINPQLSAPMGVNPQLSASLGVNPQLLTPVCVSPPFRLPYGSSQSSANDFSYKIDQQSEYAGKQKYFGVAGYDKPTFTYMQGSSPAPIPEDRFPSSTPYERLPSPTPYERLPSPTPLEEERFGNSLSDSNDSLNESSMIQKINESAMDENVLPGISKRASEDTSSNGLKVHEAVDGGSIQPRDTLDPACRGVELQQPDFRSDLQSQMHNMPCPASTLGTVEMKVVDNMAQKNNCIIQADSVNGSSMSSDSSCLQHPEAMADPAQVIKSTSMDILKAFTKKRAHALDAREIESHNQHAKQARREMQQSITGVTSNERDISYEEQQRRMQEQELLLNSGKLCLVLDLDHTLLNSAKFSEVEEEWEEQLRVAEASERNREENGGCARRELYRFPHMNMWTKLRPGIWKFLSKASELFELHVYTMGNRVYANEMAKLLDPSGELFAGRVISKGDETEKLDGQRNKDLDGVLGMESAVVILDDSARVWPHHKNNLIVVERYMYFPCSRRQFGLSGPSLLEVGHDEREVDGMLGSALQVINKIHRQFFASASIWEMDVRDILASQQHQVLEGCKIIFSRVFPVEETQPHLHPLWRLAEQFGASCTTKIDEEVTHVVAVSLGTDKVNWALATKRFVVRPAWLEASALLYRRADESIFPL